MKTTLLVSTLYLSLAFGFAVADAASDGKTLYVRCAGCHGAKGEKYASKAESDILKELEGYKAKTYGGEKKGIMERIAGPLSEEDMKALAQYIAQL